MSLLAAAFSPFAPESNHKCYFIDGSFDPAGGPCYGNVGASMCCYSGENCQPSSALCLTSPNGPIGQYDNESSIWRRSCTDITWQDGACLAIAYDVAVESVQLTSCSDGSFCPRTADDVNTSCCDDQLGEFAVLGHARIAESVVSSIRATGNSTASSAPNTGYPTSSMTSVTLSRTTASTPTSASIAASTPTSSSPAASAAGLGQSAKIGIGVGISFGTLLIALLSLIAFRLYRSSQDNLPNGGRAKETAPEAKSLTDGSLATGILPKYELAGEGKFSEMSTPNNAHEVEAERGIEGLEIRNQRVVFDRSQKPNAMSTESAYWRRA